LRRFARSREISDSRDFRRLLRLDGNAKCEEQSAKSESNELL
jgi:hypothetical protein